MLKKLNIFKILHSKSNILPLKNIDSNLDINIVVSRYNEDLQWLKNKKQENI